MQILLKLFLGSISVVLAKDPAYLAINFGLNYITATHFSNEDLPLPIAPITGKKTYQAYFVDALQNEGKRIQRYGEWYIRDGHNLVPAPPDTHDFEHAQSIFVAVLGAIKDAASGSLNRPVEIATVTRPRHFNDSSYGAVVKAAVEVEPSIKQPWQIIDSINAARLAYNLNTCGGLGLNVETRNLEDDLHLIIFIEYNEMYLELSLAGVTEYTCGIKGQIRIDNLGSAALKTKPIVGTSWLTRLQVFCSDQPLHHLNSSEETYYQKIQVALETFLIDHKVIPENHIRWTSIRAIVVSGDATQSAFKNLLGRLPAALGEHQDKVRYSIDPKFVGAVGAGYRGRHQTLTPGFLDDIMSSNVVPHDEL